MKLDDVSETDEDKYSSATIIEASQEEFKDRMGPTKTLETKSPDSAVGEGSYFEDLSIQIPNSCRNFKQTAVVKPTHAESPDLSPMSPE
jgi:hypothetical protein